jgi:3-oxoacyl-[acyl-carrier protein] reductase
MKKIALITGAAGGIGQAITLKLAETLDGLILLDIDALGLKTLCQTLDHKLPKLYLECDLAKKKDIQRAISSIQQHFELPNILINNAGYGGTFVKVDKLTYKEWQRILNVNLTSIFYLSKFLLPHMQQQGFGRIVNIASMQGLFGGIGSSA